MLRFRNIRKVFAGDTVALDRIDFEVPQGQFCVFLGASGAGKTTLLRMVSGLVEPSEGTVELDDIPVIKANLASIRRKIGMIHQQLHLVPRLSVFENVLSGALPEIPTWRALLGLFPLSLKRKTCALLDLVHLGEEHLYRRAATLSGGQQQRVAIARAFILDPEVVLADEPVANLDPANSWAILDLLKAASRRAGTTVLCNLHHIDMATEFADRIIGLHRGRIVFDGAPDALGSDDIKRIYHLEDATVSSEPGQPELDNATPSFNPKLRIAAS